MFDIKHTIRAPDTFAPLEKILLPAENCHLFVNSCIIFIKTIQAGEVWSNFGLLILLEVLSFPKW